MKLNLSNILIIILFILLISFGVYHLINRLNLNKEINILKQKIEDVVLRQSEILDSFNEQLILSINSIKQDLTDIIEINKTNLNYFKKNVEHFEEIYKEFNKSLSAYSNAWNKIADLLGNDEFKIKIE